jgi:hypothetical protein
MTRKSPKRQDVHIVLQGKGGIGKSYTASLLLQYLADKGQSVIGIDTDPSNSTFVNSGNKNVEQLNIMDGNKIDIKKFDELLKRIADTNDDYVIDIGSSCFIAYQQYCKSMELYSILEEMLGVKVYLYIILVGGEAKDQTLIGLDEVVTAGVPEKSVILIENEHFGVIDEDIRVIDSKGIQSIASKIYGGLVLEQVEADLLGKDLHVLQTGHMIFKDVSESEQFNFVEKLRLGKYKTKLWKKFDGLYSLPIAEPVKSDG